MDGVHNVGKIKIRNITDLMPETAVYLHAVVSTTPPTPPKITNNSIENEDAIGNKTTCKPSRTKASLSTTNQSAACTTTKKPARSNRKNENQIIGQVKIDTFFKSTSKNFNIEPLKSKLEPLTCTEGSVRKRNNNNATTKTPGKLMLKKKTGRKRLFTASDSDSIITINTCDSKDFEQKPKTKKKGTRQKSPRKQPRRSARNKPETIIVDLTLDIDESDNEMVNKAEELITPKTITEPVTPEPMTKEQHPTDSSANHISSTSAIDVKTPCTTTEEDSKYEPKQFIISLKNGKVKQVPPYKIVEGTTFAVDAFDYGDIPNVTHYFLTHYHADHYVGLSGKFQNILYATKTTIRLISTFMPSVNQKFLHELELNEPLIVDNVEVTAIDANHCPGAIMLVFKLKTGKCILHTGDFRACSNMESEPVLWNNHVSLIYLDTTYLSDKYDFCHQSESIIKAIDIIEKFQEKNAGKRILYVCGTYLVGKENFWTSLAQYFDWKVWAENQRYKSLTALGNPDIDNMLCQDIKKAQLHIIPLMKLKYDYLLEYFLKLKTDHEVLFALRPSGWEKNSRPQYRGAINIVGIEYSEHSSHKELERFVKFLKPDRVISTVPVGGSPFITGQVPLSWYKYKGYGKMFRNVQLSITAFTKNLSATRTSKTQTPTISNEANISRFVVSPIKKRSGDNDDENTENINKENAIKTRKISDSSISIEQQKLTKHKTTTTPEVPKPNNHLLYQSDAEDDGCHSKIISLTENKTTTTPEVPKTHNHHIYQSDAEEDWMS